MTLPNRARIAGILAICLLMVSAPVALAGSVYQPDAQIRLGSSGSYWGENVYYPFIQALSYDGVVGQKFTFFIKIQNDADASFTDSFKVRRSAGFTNGYRVRYYNAAGTDVTGQVNTGSFTTPSLAPGADYVMRATVKIQSWATPCSFTSRNITVSSVSDSNAKDVVQFIVFLAQDVC